MKIFWGILFFLGCFSVAFNYTQALFFVEYPARAGYFALGGVQSIFTMFLYYLWKDE